MFSPISPWLLQFSSLGMQILYVIIEKREYIYGFNRSRFCLMSTDAPLMAALPSCFWNLDTVKLFWHGKKKNMNIESFIGDFALNHHTSILQNRKWRNGCPELTFRWTDLGLVQLAVSKHPRVSDDFHSFTTSKPPSSPKQKTMYSSSCEWGRLESLLLQFCTETLACGEPGFTCLNFLIFFDNFLLLLLPPLVLSFFTPKTLFLTGSLDDELWNVSCSSPARKQKHTELTKQTGREMNTMLKRLFLHGNC